MCHSKEIQLSVGIKDLTTNKPEMLQYTRPQTSTQVWRTDDMYALVQKEFVQISYHKLMSCVFPVRVLAYQPSVRMPDIQTLDQSCLTSSLVDYGVPFQPSTLPIIPADMQSKLIWSVRHSHSLPHVISVFLSLPYRSVLTDPDRSSGKVPEASQMKSNV